MSPQAISLSSPGFDAALCMFCAVGKETARKRSLRRGETELGQPETVIKREGHLPLGCSWWTEPGHVKSADLPELRTEPGTALRTAGE
ncbi:hypothetical protein DPEC_G00088380 [Dallia pectoralis]|uniref:Uncharacterized protein n=1 Tax=Dallia pectoralis TaxID=75939 RepID=A0ACC2H024_DALPE|nr:hypothetical protein DPEC_G00088380 [Dallia pectoralis]